MGLSIGEKEISLGSINVRIAELFFVTSVIFAYYGDLKWGFSLLIMSFFMNLAAIYATLVDDGNKFQIRNLIAKIIMFIFQVIMFNWGLIAIGITTLK